MPADSEAHLALVCPHCHGILSVHVSISGHTALDTGTVGVDSPERASLPGAATTNTTAEPPSKTEPIVPDQTSTNAGVAAVPAIVNTAPPNVASVGSAAVVASSVTVAPIADSGSISHTEAATPRATPSAQDIAAIEELCRVIAKKISDRNFRLPPMPTVAQRMLQLSANASVADVARVVSLDQGLASSIIRMANSVFYGARCKFENLPAAISRIGLEQVQRTVLGLSLLARRTRRRLFQEEHRLLTEHSIGCAYFAGILADIRGASFRQDAFLAGLLHDVGKLVIYTAIADEIEHRQMSDPPMELMASLVSDYHGNVGAFVTTAWDLPSWLQEVTRFHHRFHEASTYPLLVACVALANRLCHRYGLGCEPEEIDLFADGLGELVPLSEENVERLKSSLEQIRDLVKQISAPA